MSKTPIKFYFDFISVFAYLAAVRIDDMAARYDREVEWHSILLGVSVVRTMGLKPLLETPIKGDYLKIDAARYARRHGLPLVLPKGHELIDPLPPARAFQWLKVHHPDHAKAVALDLLTAYWGHGVDVSRADIIAATAARHGLDGETVAAAAVGHEAKDLLRADVEQAIELGAFGSPFFLVDGEPFWGADKLELVEAWLAEGGW